MNNFSSSFQTLGFFSLNLKKQVKVTFVEDYDQLYSFASRNRISSIYPVGADHLQLSLNNDPAEPKFPSRKSNCVIGKNIQLISKLLCRRRCFLPGAFVTSISRVVVHRHMMAIDKVGGRVLKVACDALFYVLPRETEDPLEYSESFGRWKRVFSGPIQSLIQMSQSNYCTQFVNRDGKTVTQAKASGLVSSHFLTEGLNFQLYSDMCDKLISQEKSTFETVKFDNVRKKTNTKSLSFTVIRRKQTVFSHNVFFKRKLNGLKKSYLLLPYGFNPKD